MTKGADDKGSTQTPGGGADGAARGAAKADPPGTAKAEAKADKPEAKGDKTEAKPEAKTDKAPAKGDKTEAKSVKTEAKTDKAEAKTDKAEKKAERRPDTQTPRKNDTGLPGKRLFVDPTLHVIDALDAEAVAIGLCSDVRPLAGAAGYIDWRMCGRISQLLRQGAITGIAGEKVLLPTLGMIPAGRIFVFGWGEKRGLLDNAVARLTWMADVLKQAGVERVAVALPEPAGILVGLVDEHLKKPLGDKLALVFGPDELMTDVKDTRPIPAAPPPTSPG